MTQHTDMGGLVERLRSWLPDDPAQDQFMEFRIDSEDLRLLLDAIEALSIPQGLGEKK